MKLLDFPHLRQTYDYDCGANALQAVLAYYGIEIRAELLIKQTKVHPRYGIYLKEIIRVIKRHKLSFDVNQMTTIDVRASIDKKIPVMMMVQAWATKKVNYATDWKNGHWVVAIGYDRNRILFEDPYSFHRVFLTEKELEQRWHANEEGEKTDHLGLRVYGKKPTHQSQKMLHMD